MIVVLNLRRFLVDTFGRNLFGGFQNPDESNQVSYSSNVVLVAESTTAECEPPGFVTPGGVVVTSCLLVTFSFSPLLITIGLVVTFTAPGSVLTFLGLPRRFFTVVSSVSSVLIDVIQQINNDSSNNALIILGLTVTILSSIPQLCHVVLIVI
uniref:Uncharacterized protein n=1 Tax=Cacopsylla melanoneura TaxID=428564 RepID=A0A8D8QBW0_9HEMI